MYNLIQLVTKWLRLKTLTGPQIVERVVMDWYLWSLLVDLQRWMCSTEYHPAPSTNPPHWTGMERELGAPIAALV